MASSEVPWASVAAPSQRRGLRVCILGGACIGLSTAVALARRLRTSPIGCEVTISVLSDSFPPHTTSNVAAGLVRPFSVSGTDPSLLEKWILATHEWLNAQAKLPSAPDRGIFPSFVVEGSDNAEDPPSWAKNCRAFQMLSGQDRAELKTPLAWMYKSLIVQSGPYLVWLKELCSLFGVNLLTQKVNSLDEVDDYDLVVNCTGLRSRQLFHDPSLVPVRGQVLRVNAPWVKNAVMIHTGDMYTYIIPNRDFLVLGGTLQVDNWNSAVDPADTEDIWTRCCSLVPSLQSATIIEAVVGLRPYRKEGVRIEREEATLRNGKTMPVVHNYGHGGAGYTIHWGCAQDAVDLIMPALKAAADVQSGSATSKL